MENRHAEPREEHRAAAQPGQSGEYIFNTAFFVTSRHANHSISFSLKGTSQAIGRRSEGSEGRESCDGHVQANLRRQVGRQGRFRRRHGKFAPHG